MTDTVAVSGATGFIGSTVVRKLLESGRSVRAIVEPGANTKNLDALPQQRLDRTTADVTEFDAMRKALSGCSTFFHLAAVYKIWLKDPAIIYRVNLEGTTSALLAAQAAGVSRTVYTSSIAAVGLHPDGKPADESVEFNLYDVANEYILTKYLSERIAMRFAQASHPIVIVNPAFPFGPGDIGPTPTGRIIVALLKGEVPGIGEGGFCAIDVEDVADAHIAAETKGRVGERYILGNHNVSFRDFAELVCKIGGVPTPKLKIPSTLGRGIALGMELWADHVSHREPPATYRGLMYMQKYAYFDPSKARTELGLKSRPLSVSVERAVDYFRKSGMA